MHTMQNKLFLIDGHALMFRMYYAFLRRPITNSKGDDSSVIYGFMKYLLELTSKYTPSHLAVVFDPSGKTFRHEMYSGYKANRSATPEVIKDSLAPLVTLLRGIGVTVIIKEGFEADDVIGSIAKQFASEELPVYMITPDKDLGQIIAPNIFQLKPGKSGAENELLDTAGICKKYGIQSPSSIIDILAIWGDSSDNIPGVKGIGEVGAGKLVGKYHTVENILEHLDELPAKQAANIREHKEDMILSKKLATIRCDIPIDITADCMALSFKNSKEASEILEYYECRSLMKMLPSPSLFEASAAESSPTGTPTTQDYILTEKSIGEVLKNDTHGSEIALSYDENSRFLTICRAVSHSEIIWTYSTPEKIKEGGYDKVLSSEKTTIIGSGLKEIFKLFFRHGINISGKLLDIELLHYLISPETSHKSEVLVREFLKIEPQKYFLGDKEEQQEPDLFQAVLPLAHERPSDSIRVLTCLSIPVSKAIREFYSRESSLEDLYMNIEMPLIKILGKMEMNGVSLDTAMLYQYGQTLKGELARIENKVRECVDEPLLNLSSPMQLGNLLFDKMKLDPKAKRNKRGHYSTDEETLTAISDRHPIINDILEFREVKKLISTYIEPLPLMIDPIDRKIHTTFNQALTATGRLSSVHPNLQNIPIRSQMGKEIRRAFIPSGKENTIISADYSQIELRIVAHLSKDPDMIEAFLHGVDIHTATAAKIYKEDPTDVTSEQRRKAKSANFGIIYGISAFGLAQRLKIPRSEAKDLITGYFETYPSIEKFIEEQKEKARESGYVETMFGRKRYLKDIKSANATVRAFAERNAINAPIQGTAADIIKIAMINVDRALEKAGLQTKMILQVHDELVFDVPVAELEQARQIIKYEMENVVSLSVPLVVECNNADNWLEAH